MNAGTCRSCGAAIVWLKTAAGKNMPADAAVTTVVTEDGQTVRGHVTHWSTCPSAEQHRKPAAQKELL